MPDNKLELVVEVDVDRANASIKGINKGLSSFEQAARNAARGASQGIDGFTVSVAKGAAAGAVLASAFEKVLGWIKEVGLETVKYAARTEALTVVTDQLARVNGYSESSVQRLVERVKALGISTQEAHGVVQRMIFAQLDLSKATELARLAQDAAVISGVNSSEALENIIIGITTGQTRLLHNMGLQVSLEQTIAKGERELGRAMTEREKRSYMLNEVLAQGVKIHGAYEAAMTTAHKQMMSLTRYFQEARNAIGSEFLPEMNKAIQILSDAAKWLKDNADAVAWWARALVDVAVGAAIAKFVMWIGGAKKAVDGLTASLARNPWTALIIATTVVGTKLYEAYQESKRFEEQLQKQTKVAGDAAHILYYVGEQGKTVEDLKKMGYSIDQIKAAFLGTTDAADKFLERMDNLEFKTGLKITNQADLDAEQARRAQELSREIAKKQAEIERSTFEAA